MKHADILHSVQFDVESNPENVLYVPAVADELNPGVLDPITGKAVKTPHNPFVDDTLMADILHHIQTAMAASLESLFQLLGFPAESLRRSPLSLDKIFQAHCS